MERETVQVERLVCEKSAKSGGWGERDDLEKKTTLEPEFLVRVSE